MELQKAIDILEKSDTIGLLFPEKPGIDALAAAEVIADSLKKREKLVGFLSDTHFGKENIERFQTLAGATKLPKEFIISLDASRAPASELRYEKTNDRIDVIFSPRGSEITKENVSFRDGNIQCDSLVALGIADIERAAEAVTDDPGLLTRTPIVAVDSGDSAPQFGEVNIGDGRPLSEIVYALVSAMEKAPPDARQATLLLAGILSHTQTFSTPAVKPETLLAASELMRAGGEYADALRFAKNHTPLSLLQLASRAGVRSKEDESGAISWSFLTAEDFEKTGHGAGDAERVLGTLHKEFPSGNVLVLCAQNPEGKKIHAHVAGPKETLMRILESAGGEEHASGILLPMAFETFKDAEEHIRSLLGEAL